MNKYVTILLFTILIAGQSFCQEWKPAEVPIKTVWADEVDPNNVLSEYPGPLMVREEWKNQNELWDFQSVIEGDPLPLKGKMETQIPVPFPWESSLLGNKVATEEYERFIKMILEFRKEGLSASVYTQWTDPENEMNEIYTYDRKVIQADKEKVTKANLSTRRQKENQE